MNIKDKRTSFFVAAILFLLLRPYFSWSFIENSFIKTGLLIIVAAVFFSYKRKIANKEVPYLAVFLCAAFCYSFFAIIQGRVNTNGFLNSLTCFLLISIPLCKRQFGGLVYGYFATLFALFVGASLISWFIYSTIGLPQLGILELASQHRQYLHYPLFVIEIADYASLDMLRFSGPFDEPGVIGTYSALTLAVSRFNYKDWRMVIIFIAGILSFSLFFYIVSISFLLFYYIVVMKKILVPLLLSCAVVVIFSTTQDNPILYEYIWKRTEWDTSSNKFEGDNRQNDAIDSYIERTRGSVDYFMGTTDYQWVTNVADERGLSYKSVICIHGVIFFILYLAFFMMLGIINKKRKSDAILYSMVVLANFYQRPSVFIPVPVFLYCAYALDFYMFNRMRIIEK